MDKTTDELIDRIIEIGTKLPTYDYDYRKFISEVPENINIGGSVRGIENADMHDTFKEGCLRIINWYNENFEK